MDKFMMIYKKLFKNNLGNSLIDIMEQIINDLEKDKKKNYIHNVKHTTREYICEIIHVLSNNTSWRKHIGKIDGRVLNNKHNYYVKIGVYEKLYELNLDTYLKNNLKETKVLSLIALLFLIKMEQRKLDVMYFIKIKKE